MSAHADYIFDILFIEKNVNSYFHGSRSSLVSMLYIDRRATLVCFIDVNLENEYEIVFK